MFIYIYMYIFVQVPRCPRYRRGRTPCGNLRGVSGIRIDPGLARAGTHSGPPGVLPQVFSTTHVVLHLKEQWYNKNQYGSSFFFLEANILSV